MYITDAELSIFLDLSLRKLLMCKVSVKLYIKKYKTTNIIINGLVLFA